ncbi:alpha/beta hydrolase [Microbacterium sp. Marseille-Q6965]|uniref:alpha/beta hydrolase n=1 Tax=Microbacterium sp. Marseille-Q6965 TaxID=2965072 RepID=UPI0021B78F85|nr:lysophospholipase [Microbacterium sp. Marseille-Q6965]
MKHPRRAAPLGVGLLLAATGIGLIAGAIGAVAARIARVARVVVTPAMRVADVEVQAVDTAAQTITLSRTPDTELPGRYGLFTSGTAEYLKIGAVLRSDEETVTRKLLTHIGRGASIAQAAAFSGWYFESPAELHVPYRDVEIATPVGASPAWLVPAGVGDDDGTGEVWAVVVHGRGTQRAETIRAVPAFREAGITSLLISYRNDGVAPQSTSGLYGLGTTEWPDVEAAIEFALEHGARRIVLMGWSMGGAIALQTLVNTAHRESIAGLILESPVVDWRTVLRFQARALGMPPIAASATMGMLESGIASRMHRIGRVIDFDALDMVARGVELDRPILILHSDDDGYVPSDASRRLAELRPDIVTLVPFATARHTKLWNYDEARWNTAIRDWLATNTLAPETD